MIDDNHPGAHDCHRPPDVPTLVHCMKCHHEYDSYLMVWRQDEGEPACWCCPTPDCDGRGFGLDIVVAEPDFDDDEWLDHEGECLFDDDDELDDDWEAEMEAWGNLEPEFQMLIGCDLMDDDDDANRRRVDGLIGDPTPQHHVRFDDLGEQDIPF